MKNDPLEDVKGLKVVLSHHAHVYIHVSTLPHVDVEYHCM